MDVYVMLLAEDGNPYDANAVSVWIDGLMVGYLPRDEARRLRPGLLALQEREGKPIALEGCAGTCTALAPRSLVPASKRLPLGQQRLSFLRGYQPLSAHVPHHPTGCRQASWRPPVGRRRRPTRACRDSE